MKIGFISDTHEQVKMIQRAVDVFNSLSCDMVIHLGDICSPIMAGHFKALKMPMKIIFGNNDGDREFLRERFADAEFYNGPRTFNLQGKRAICMHEPILIKELMASDGYDMIAYGHTHRAKVEVFHKTILLNPGEASGLITDRPSIALWDTQRHDVELIYLTENKDGK